MSLSLFERRKQRVRTKIRAKSGGRLRLSVFRSNLHIYAQIIDDVKGATLVAASTAEGTLKAQNSKGWNKAAAALVGTEIAKRAAEKGIKEVVFDRGGYIYHGRIKALADAARDAGLSF